MKTKIAGMYLWAVDVGGHTEHFWITTRRKSVLDAVTKAETFFKKEFGYKKVIQKISSHGTIDA